jgi:hypothetical protein
LLFVLFSAVAVAMCLWTAVSALRGIPEHDKSHRAWTLAAASLLPPVTALTAFGPWLELPGTRPLIAILPVLIVAGTWSNAMTLRDQGLLRNTLHLPVFAFNTGLAGLYAVRAAQDLSGADLGTWGTAITGGHALLMTFVGDRAADTNPVWLHLPLLLPLWLRYGAAHTLALAACSAIAAALVATLAAAMPLAFDRAESYRRPVDPPAAMRSGQRVGVEVAWADRLLSPDERDDERARLSGLGVDMVTIEVGPELFEDAALLRQTREELDFARARGLTVTVACRPPARFGRIPAADVAELSRAMAKVHWLAAEKLAPDVLFLYTGPFGSLDRATARIGTIDEWTELARRGASEARQGNPAVAVGIVLDSRAPHAEELFVRLGADDSGIDILGLSVRPDALTPDDLETALRVLDRWCRRIDRDRPIWLCGTGACPWSTGGELGQWHFLATVLSWAARNQRITGVSISALTDERHRGMLARDGRPRLAYGRLRAVLRDPRPSPR